MKSLLKLLLSSVGYRLVRIDDEPRLIVRAFADEMERELAAHEYKGGWQDSSAPWLLEQLQRNAYQIHYALRDRMNAATVRKQCADVANFAMMIADVAGELLPLKSRGF